MKNENYYNGAAHLPSGYSRVEQLETTSQITERELPWLSQGVQLSTVRCTLNSGNTFLLASAVSTHRALVEAADRMNAQQDRNTNNMFYSRIAGFVENNFTPSAQVNTFPEMTGLPTFCLRNEGGQRVYFSVLSNPQTSERLIIKLAACDKENQHRVLKVIDTKSSRSHLHMKAGRIK